MHSGKINIRHLFCYGEWQQCQHHPTWCSNEASILHPTMLGDIGPTFWLRLNRPLHRESSLTTCVTQGPREGMNIGGGS